MYASFTFDLHILIIIFYSVVRLLGTFDTNILSLTILIDFVIADVGDKDFGALVREGTVMREGGGGGADFGEWRAASKLEVFACLF